MAQSTIQSYDDPKAYEAAFVGARAEITPMARGPARYGSTRITFNHLWLARTSETAPRVRRSHQIEDRSFFRFLPHAGRGPVLDGLRLQANELLVHPRGHRYLERTDGASAVVVMSVPRRWAQTALPLLSGRDPQADDTPRLVIPDPADLNRLRTLVAETMAVAEFTPCVLGQAPAARSLEQALLDALVRCLAPAMPAARQPPRAARLMGAFSDLLEAAGDEPVHVPDICMALGVPERSFRACCQAQLGISPHAFLLRRRLYLARAALAAPAADTTVTQVATRFGFWHFGRFAHDYRETFGESPSDTLRGRPPLDRAA